MVSTRYRRATTLLMAAAAIAVGFLSQNPRHVDPCAQPQALALTSLIPGARHGENKGSTDQHEFVLRAEGTFENPLSKDHPFTYRIVRSHEILYLASRPLNLVSDNTDGERHRVTELEIDGTVVPVHVVEDYAGAPNLLIAYFHIYGLEPTEAPIATHLWNFPTVVAEGSPTITTVIVNGALTRQGLPAAEAAALDFLSSAWSHFDRFCSSNQEAEAT